MDPILDILICHAAESGASDLHLIAGLAPAFRINGEIQFGGGDVLSETQIATMAESLLNPVQSAKFASEWELCISIVHPVAGRIRTTVYKHNGSPELSLRLCGSFVASQADLGLPPKLDDLARKRNGLVLICGPTGAGKTTTLNYIVNLINQERRCKIITIEDPIEYLHENQKAIVVQQEVLRDTHSFTRALTHVLRQDPDVIVVGEMRYPEDIATALMAAETGHLVLSTIHASSAIQTLERIIGVFDGSAQRQVILQLANTLQGILVQELLPSADRQRRVLAYEFLVANNAVRNLIRENQLFHLESCIQTGGKDGMLTMDTCLAQLHRRCLISYDTALARARHPDQIAKTAL